MHDDTPTSPAQVPKNIEEVDIVCFGFPCQDISVAGTGAGIWGPRSRLFFDCMRWVRALRPRIVVVENSPLLLARGFGDVLRELASSGFDAEWDCVPASAVGAPHQRDRLWVVVHGACGHRTDGAFVGVDLQAEDWCKERGVDCVSVPALWDARGKSAGPRRNRFMLEVFLALLADRDSRGRVLAFDGGRGTAGMKSLARKAGLEVIYRPPP